MIVLERWKHDLWPHRLVVLNDGSLRAEWKMFSTGEWVPFKTPAYWFPLFSPTRTPRPKVSRSRRK
jgi:hypothetical protein